MNERTYVNPGEDNDDMQFSTTEGEDTKLSAAALDELSNNKGEDE